MCYAAFWGQAGEWRIEVSDQRGTTLQDHLAACCDANKAEPGLARLLLDVAAVCIRISGDVNKAGLIDILGLTDKINVHGEEVKKLDLYADELIIGTLRESASVCAMGSEEREDLIAGSVAGEMSDYVILFDPLDGSSNIDVNVSIGTIFSIYRRKSPQGPATVEDLTQPGRDQVAAGYVLYGSSTMLVYSLGDGVHGFTLDPQEQVFRLSHASIQVPARGKIYSCNEAYTHFWDRGTCDYIAFLKDPGGGPGHPYSGRYVGSFVADFHRNLLKGGIFLYPADRKKPGALPKGKLRLMYEANPMAYIIEQAGGAASDGSARILDIRPEGIHHRVALIIGSSEDVREYETFFEQGGGPE